MKQVISIIIPVYKEEQVLPAILQSLSKLLEGIKSEVLIIDGGASSTTKELCMQYQAKYLRSELGRAKQMNKGADYANGEVLYFLHADSQLPENGITSIIKAIRNNIDAGCFRLRFYPSHPILKFYAWFTRFDLNILRFGDQSLFIKKKVFTDIGGFDETLDVMEDQEIIYRIKRKATFKVLPAEIGTSARRYEQVGRLRLQWVFICIVGLYYLGVSQTIIKDFYMKQMQIYR